MPEWSGLRHIPFTLVNRQLRAPPSWAHPVVGSACGARSQHGMEASQRGLRVQRTARLRVCLFVCVSLIAFACLRLLFFLRFVCLRRGCSGGLPLGGLPLTAGKLWCCAHILLSVAALGDLVARFDEVIRSFTDSR